MEQVLEQLRAGALLIDLRAPADFCAGHPPGAVSVRFDDRHLADRLERVVGVPAPVVLLAAEASQLAAAARQLDEAGRVVLGVAPADTAAWAAAGAAWVPLPATSTEALSEAPEGRAFHVLDVREPVEWEVGHVPGAQLIALGEVHARLDEVPRDRDVAVICEAGVRSASAASLLQRAGHTRVFNVADGTAGYRRSGRRLELAPTTEEDDQ